MLVQLQKLSCDIQGRSLSFSSSDTAFVCVFKEEIQPTSSVALTSKMLEQLQETNCAIQLEVELIFRARWVDFRILTQHLGKLDPGTVFAPRECLFRFPGVFLINLA